MEKKKKKRIQGVEPATKPAGKDSRGRGVMGKRANVEGSKMDREMPYKLVVCDLDGTLLNNEKKLQPSTENTIRDLVQSGVLFATASARTKPFAMNAISSIKDVCCANAYVNGAFTQTADGTVLIDRFIDEEDVSVLVEQCNDVGASFCCMSKNEMIARIRHPEFEEDFKKFFGKYAETSYKRSNFKTHFMAIYAENVQPIREYAIEHLPNVETSPYVRFMLQTRPIEALYFQYKGIHKGAALRHIAEHFDVDLSETMAIGDGIWNDGPMMDAAGCGVAMKNAHQEIIKKANEVTKKDNNEDGVGDYLRSLFVL